MAENPEAVSKPLAGQVAIVTGASSGLGNRFARVLARAGATVGVIARRADRLATLVDEIRAEGGQAEAFALDLTDAEAVVATIAAIGDRLGLITIAINNAGVAFAQPAIEQKASHIDVMTNVNIRAPFLIATEVAARLIAAGKPGRIVNIASIAAYNYDGKVPSAYYAVTKSAVVRMTEALAVEWAPHHINVNAIAPGIFRSEMSEPLLATRGDWIRERQTRKRIGEPHQLDSTLLYLVAPETDFVTGTCIKVEDGQLPR